LSLPPVAPSLCYGGCRFCPWTPCLWNAWSRTVDMLNFWVFSSGFVLWLCAVRCVRTFIPSIQFTCLFCCFDIKNSSATPFFSTSDLLWMCVCNIATLLSYS
jgi:hypothetical protein